METQIIVIQSSGEQTNVHIYGANSIKEMGESIGRAFKVNDAMIYFHEDSRFIDALKKTIPE